MAKKLKLYRCTNKACSLGAVGESGHFTGGLTQEQAEILTGNPDAPHGEGVCPNCGKAGRAAGEHASISGRDPLEVAHQAIAARVADPDDELTSAGAQAALLEEVG